MDFTPRTARVLKEIAIGLDGVSVGYGKRATLQALRNALTDLLVDIQLPGEGSVAGFDSAATIIEQAVGSQNVLRVADKLAVQTFIDQFPITFEASDALRDAATNLITALRTIGKNEEVSSKLAAALDSVQRGIDELPQAGDKLILSGDIACIDFPSLDQGLKVEWELAKEAFKLRRVFSRRHEIFNLQRSAVASQKDATSGVTRLVTTPIEREHDTAADISEVFAPIISEPAGIETALEPEDDVDELTSELIASISNRSTDRSH